MPFALVIIGLIMIVTGAKGTQSALGAQLSKDFTGDKNFLYWFAAIGSLGALGSIQEFKTFSRTFMALVVIALVIHNGGIFDKLMKAIKTGPIAPPRPAQAADAGHNTGVSSVLSGTYDLQQAGKDFTNALGGWVGLTTNTANQSIATSKAQSGNASSNFSAVAKVAGAIFGF